MAAGKTTEKKDRVAAESETKLDVRIIFLCLFAIPLVAGVSLLVTEGGKVSGEESMSAADGGSKPRLNGLTLEAPRRQVGPDWVQHFKQVNANWVAIVPYAFCGNNQHVHYARRGQKVHGGWWGESPVGVRTTIQHAKSQGLKVMLKPQIWFRGIWAGQFQLQTSAHWQSWEQDYDAYIDTMLQIAREEQVELFCLGTELRHSFNLRPDYWRGLIRRVRAVYDGKLTIAANWDNYHNVRFWSDLDYIGIDAYFPLTREAHPGVETLWAKWFPICNKLERFSRRHGRPILFTEYGYRSLPQTTWNNWEKEHQYHYPVDLEAQATALTAMYQCFWPKDWFAGGFLWKYRLPHNVVGGPEDNNYTPQNKPAEEIVRTAYQNFP